MFKLSKISFLILVLLFGCSTTSMEFRSAKSAARAEKNLKRGEEWGLKALKVPTDQKNALVPYFLATEIYKPQERWDDMADMLNETEKRNPDQKLEKPIILDPENITKETILLTVGQGVKAYREEAWTIIFNQAIELINANDNQNALIKLNSCLRMDSSRPETYTALVGYYVGKEDFKTAKEYVEKGINANPSYLLYAMAAELLEQEFRFSENDNKINLINDAEEMCIKAINMAEEIGEDAGSLKIKLFLLNLEMGKNQKAINIANELLDVYYDNPDLYFNVAVLYQRLATKLYDEASASYLSYNNDNSSVNIESMYQQFTNSMDYAQKSKEKFLEANDLEIEDTGSREAAAEMRKLMKQIKEIYIPSVKEMASNQGINLN